jgi:hypothetical protein
LAVLHSVRSYACPAVRLLVGCERVTAPACKQALLAVNSSVYAWHMMMLLQHVNGMQGVGALISH